MQPKYPVYIISKGRWESRQTSIALELMKVPYRIVIESQEYKEYAAVIDPAKILVLPFSNLGQGGIPARNWVWEHSISEGHERHWILDDNIKCFYRFNDNKRVRVTSGTTFRAAEDFTDRYENVKISGMQYFYFIPKRSTTRPAYLANTRVYSCLLIANDTAHRWRGRYNEDTDLSLRVLKDGDCTILFNAFLCGKTGTLSMKGGNTEEIYGADKDNRYKFAKSLYDQHPDVVEIVEKYGRWHHHVDYRPFENNRLIKKAGLNIKKGVDNYGMELIRLNEEDNNGS